MLFKKNTHNSTVVMGSKTWKDPLMPWPLPDRKNVLATSRDSEFPGADLYINGDLCTEIKKLWMRRSILRNISPATGFLEPPAKHN